MKIHLVPAIAVLCSAPLFVKPMFAQLAPPNALGASIGHVHINASDVEAQQRFWTAVGGKVINREKLVMVQFPGIYVLLRKQEYTGGSAGSVVNHFGFYIRDFDQAVAKWKAAGLKWEPGNNPGQGFLIAPDEVRVEIYENKSLHTPVWMHHIHLQVPDPIAAQKWYVEHFGATAGKRGQSETANVPGAEIAFTKNDMKLAPSKGRSIDHIGFEVTNIDQFVAKLTTAGIKTDAAIRNSANASGLRIVYVTDPWGTEIEITEGLAPKS